MTGLKDLLRIERARHFLVALAIAAALGVTGFLNPMDWLIWASQAKLVERPASKDIIFISGADNLADPARPQQRRDLARLISGLTSAGAERIFLDVRFEEPSDPATDRMLRMAIGRSGRTYLVDRYKTVLDGLEKQTTLPAIAGAAPRVVSKQRTDLFGWVWSANLGLVEGGQLQQSFAAGLADVPAADDADFRIDYSIDYRSVPTVRMHEALNVVVAEEAQILEGKIVVIGSDGRDAQYSSIPGHRKVPASMVAILAGETLRAGPITDIGWIPTFMFFSAGLAVVLVIKRRPKARHQAYLLAGLAIPAWYLLSAHLRTTAHLSVPIAFLAIYLSCRAWNSRNRATSLVDELSGLPNFRALERDLARHASLSPVSVVVARIHRFDEVLAILPPDSHGDYVRQIAERFRITEKGLTVYSNAGRYLAWLQQADDETSLEAHLHGLRAVFATPLLVGQTPIDVGITFGVDSTRDAPPSRKIASATAAVDRTTESHSPVQLTDTSSVADRIWNVSLQAKIDAALKEGQIYVVYQPQFDLPHERLCGFEALVRWNDPERGAISPSYFVEQCEHAGRMEALTRKVFTESVAAIGCSEFAESSYRLSVNVSATMLGDDRVLDILERTLAGSNLETCRLTIEVTETARISDFDRARAVLSQIRALGMRTSIDDFGVGAANVETLLRLPFDELKIDRAFVSRIKDDVKARQITQSLINLGNGIGLDVVAEGVEDRFTLELLKTFGCGGVQGFLLGRPGRLSDMETHMKRENTRIAQTP